MASTYLTRTPASTGNRRTFTVSTWLKKSNTGSQRNFFGTTGGNDNSWFQIGFSNTDNIFVQRYTGNLLVTNAKYRDTSAWYHVVLEVDTTQATDSNRLKLYVNGEQVTSFSTATYPAQNFDTGINLNTEIHYIGREGGNYFDGSMSHFHFIDGTAYDADTFGNFDPTTGIWVAKTTPSVTYGTNGFFLKFENSASFGTDSSGNANTFTVNGTMTQTLDTPSNVFNTFNPNNAPTGTALENAGTTHAQTANDSGSTGNLGFTKGKWYWELKCVTGLSESGIILNPMVKSFGGLSYVTGVLNNTTIARMFNQTGTTNNFRAMGSLASTTVGASVTYAVGDIISVAVDADAGKIWFAQNGTYEGGGNPATDTSPTYDWSSNLSSIEYVIPFVYSGTGASTKAQFNFGNGYFGTTAVASAENPDDGIGIFEYDVPAGYRALCTKSINAEEYS